MDEQAEGPSLSRRSFLAGAAGAAVAAAVPVEVWAASVLTAAQSAAAAPLPATYYFFTAHEAQTCVAICSQIVPSITPPGGGTPLGATEARAAVFIDRLLAAFHLPPSVADNPAIYLHGRWSGRQPYGNESTGKPSTQYPPDQLMSTPGPAHFLTLTPLQMLSWRALLIGIDAAAAQAPAYVAHNWVTQVANGTIPGPPAGGLQKVYRDGLAAFDSWSEQQYGVSFAQATHSEQALMVEECGNPVINGAPTPVPVIAPPQAAKTLFSWIEIQTFQGSYGLPEYRGMTGTAATFMWKLIGWDGDTQPLGNSIYDDDLYGPGQGPNAGFGEAGVFQPRGDYRQYRAVDHLDNTGNVLSEADAQTLIDAIAPIIGTGGLTP